MDIIRTQVNFNKIQKSCNFADQVVRLLSISNYSHTSFSTIHLVLIYQLTTGMKKKCMVHVWEFYMK